jgi:hypothetical protein
MSSEVESDVNSNSPTTCDTQGLRWTEDNASDTRATVRRVITPVSWDEDEQYIQVPSDTLEKLSTDYKQSHTANNPEKVSDEPPTIKKPVIDFVKAHASIEISNTRIAKTEMKPSGLDWADMVDPEDTSNLCTAVDPKNYIDPDEGFVYPAKTKTIQTPNPNIPLKIELHRILNCMQPKVYFDRNKQSNTTSTADIVISKQLRDPRVHKLGQYIHTIQDSVVSVKNGRRLIGNIHEPISDECKELFWVLHNTLTNMAQRIETVMVNSNEDSDYYKHASKTMEERAISQ